MKIAGVYLAAGNSSRMGSHKLALPIGKMPLGSLALETALKSPLDIVYVVTKESDNVSWIPREMLSDRKCTIIQCPISHEGQSASLRCGVQQAKEDGVDAVIVMLADQPFITVQMIEEMINCFNANLDCRFVATSVEQSIRPPVLFASSMYAELMNLQGDTGARAILKGELLQHGKLLPCADKRLLFDVDTKEDYELIRNNK